MPRVGAGLSWTDLRCLVLADVHARFQRHQGHAARVARILEGFGPEVLDRAARDGLSPAEAVDRDTRALLDLERALALEIDGAEPSGSGGSAVASARRTSDPSYYRLTQWLFLELLARDHLVRRRCREGPQGTSKPAPEGAGGSFSARGAAAPVDGRQSGSASAAEAPASGDASQEWALDLLPFAERLFNDVDKASWPAADRKHQRSLLGRRRGTEVVVSVSRPFSLEWEELTVFTTRVEALYGVTCLLVAPGHPIIERIVDSSYEEEVARYQDRLRRGVEPRISGIRTGGVALNPINFERVPVLVSPLAVDPYSDGVVFGIPAHDADQFELARRFRLRVREVIHSPLAKFDHEGRMLAPYVGDGNLTNSGPFSGHNAKSARERILGVLARRGISRKVTRYALRTVAASSASAWGPPVPVLHTRGEETREPGAEPLDASELPLHVPSIAAADLASGKRRLRELPDPAGVPYGGETTTSDGRPCRRDTDTISPWLGQAWSFLRAVLPELDGPVEGLRDDFMAPLSAGTVPRAAPAGAEKRDAAAEPVDAGSLAAELPAAGDGPAPAPAPADESDGGGNAPADSQPAALAGAVEAPAVAISSPEPPEEPGPEVETDSEDDLDGEPRLRVPARLPAKSLRPFRSPGLRRSLPIDTVFASRALRPRDLVAVRAVTKFLYERRQLPVFEPFRRFLRVGDAWLGAPRSRAGQAAESDASACGASVDSLSRDFLGRFGADALRLQFVALGPVSRAARFDADSLYHLKRFLDRVWREISVRIREGRFVSRRVLVEKHLLIHRVTRRLERMQFHTALSALIEFISFLIHPERMREEIDRRSLETFIILLSPFAPYLASELWQELGHMTPLEEAEWPSYSVELVEPPDREYAIFIDGRRRASMVQPVDLEPEKLQSRALRVDRVREWIGNRRVARTGSVPRKLVWIALEPEGAPAAESLSP